MRIAEFRWEPYSLPFARPFSTAWGTLTERRGFVVRIREEGGGWGVGEAAPLPGFGGETLEETRAVLGGWETALIGREFDPFPAPGADVPPALGLNAAFGLDERQCDAPAARHGLELALLDLAARAAGLPLARYLHPRAARVVPVNATLGGGTPRDAANAARRAVRQGYSTLKVKVGVGSADADEARLRAVREAAGADVRLRIDANGAWSAEQAAELLERWRGIGLEYVEQPLPPSALEETARLAKCSPVPIAADESVRNREDALEILQRSAAHLLILKPMIAGGILTTLRIAREALARGVPVVITTTLDAVYARLGALHAAAALAALHAETFPGGDEDGAPNADSAMNRTPPACGLATGGLLEVDLAPDPSPPAAGRVLVPTTAGLGIPALPR